MSNFYKFISLLNGAIKRNQIEVVVPYSSIVYQFLKILNRENLIRGYQLLNFNPNNSKDHNKYIKVFVAFFEGRPVLKQLISVSTPGRRVYVNSINFKMALAKRSTQKLAKSGLNSFIKTIFFFNTPYGIITTASALINNISGQLLCIAEV